MTPAGTRVGLVGAGYIARAHLAALRSLPGVRVSAVIDPRRDAAEALAKACGDARVFDSVAAAIAADAFDRAHVLVPPHLHHAVALDLMTAGKPVLLEKPAAASGAECDSLLAAAAHSGTTVGVNQNFICHPAFVRLRAALRANTLGRPVQVSCIYNMPLRQLAARQFGHWMFRAPGNILLEQAVHPLSQVLALAGAPVTVSAAAPEPIAIAPGHDFYPRVSMALQGAALPAQLGFAVGQEFPVWRLSVVCEDGVITADMITNRVSRAGRTRWLDAIDFPLGALRGSAREIGQAAGNFVGSALSIAGVDRGGDAFQQSMAGSIAAFHRAVDTGVAPESNLVFGAGLVAVCERVAAQAFRPPMPVAARAVAPESWDVAVLGGTGFIGTHVVRALLAAGKRVAVLARSTAMLPALFDDARVKLVSGDMRDKDVLAAVIGDAKIVVNLAHGGGGASYAAILAAMRGGVEAVADVCQERGVRRLVHVGSIAALYLGPQGAAITGATPPDPQSETRADYARAKAACDRLLLASHRDRQLPVTILRPGVVVGEGASPFHSGLGFYNNSQHCLGWNAGRNALAFVLAEDVADAIVRACEAPGIEGNCYNLAGDVGWTARRYIGELATALGRPLKFHPQSPTKLWLAECGKWLIKRAAGRAAVFPSRRDLISRGMMARFDCTDAKRDLGWAPVADEAVFRRRAILVHATGP